MTKDGIRLESEALAEARRSSTRATAPKPALMVIAPPTPELEQHVLDWAHYLAEFHDDVIVQHNDKVYRIATGLAPEWFLDKVRRILGRIHMDPASSALANTRVKAEVFYTREDDGLSKTWSGPLFLNPPGGQLGTTQLIWWRELLRRWSEAACTPDEYSAIFLGFNEAVFRMLPLPVGKHAKEFGAMARRVTPMRFDVRPGVPSETETQAIVICLSRDSGVRQRFNAEFT